MSFSPKKIVQQPVDLFISEIKDLGDRELHKIEDAIHTMRVPDAVEKLELVKESLECNALDFESQIEGLKQRW